MKTRFIKVTSAVLLSFVLCLGVLATYGFGEEISILSDLKPGIVITKDQIAVLGYTETSRVIQYVLPSFNFSVSTISDGTDFVRPATLRGMQPDQILVLINGKRRHNSALLHVNGSIGRGTSGIDLNAIPVSAIDRIEILQDSASERYGSDAVAGVINIILKSDTDSTNIGIYGGQSFQSDGETITGSVNHGLNIGREGFFNLTAQYQYSGWTNRAGKDPRQIFNFLEQVYGSPSLSSGTLDPREQIYNRLNHRYGEPKSQNLYFFVNGEMPAGEMAKFYLFGGVSHFNKEAGLFNRLPSQSRTNILLFPEGHIPIMDGGILDGSLSFGYRKQFSSWQLDAGLSSGLNKFKFHMSNSANTSMGTNSPTEAELGGLQYFQTAFTLDLTGSTNVGMANPLDIGLGFEARLESYRIEQGDEASWIDGGNPSQFGGLAPAGIQGFPGFRPSNEVSKSRYILGFYGNLDLDPTEQIKLSLSTRFDQYQDTGGNLSGKLALGFLPTDKILIRGTISTGFRAPSLQQMYFNNSSTQFVYVDGSLVPLTVGTYNSISNVYNGLGFDKLKAERFTALTAGIKLQPVKDLVIQGTLFKVDVKDRIIISGRMSGWDPVFSPIFSPLGVSAAQVLFNALDTKTLGADVSLNWTIPLGDSHALSFSAAGSWNKTEVKGDVKLPENLEGYQDTFFNRIERNYIENAQPQQRYMFRTNYQNGSFLGEIRFNYLGGVTVVESTATPDLDQDFSGKWLTDLELSHEILQGIRIAAGTVNLFDVYPDENIPGLAFNGIFPYPRRNAPFGIIGGFYYARLILHF